MARDKDGLELLMQQLAKAPWWVSVIVALGVYIGLRYVLPSMVGPSPFVDAFSRMAGWLASVFLITAAFSLIRVWYGRRLLGTSRSKDAIRKLDWRAFEALIEAYYRKLGFRVYRDPNDGADGGVDVRISKRGGMSYLVQCKQWRSRRVGVKVVRELYGVVAAEGATGGIVVTSGSYTAEAIDFARGVAMELIDGDRLLDMVRDQLEDKTDETEGNDESAQETNICPRCGSVLVLRTARRGSKTGNDFYGCSSFPRCRFTKPC